MNKEIILIYDKQCPVCRYYCQNIQLQESAGHLKIINARENTDELDEITQRGLNIDQGMVLKVNNTFYSGSDAIHILALIRNRSGVINRLNYWLFKSKIISRYIYPILRFFRLLLLKILAKKRINNLKR